MTPFVKLELNEEAQQAGLIAAYENSHYRVFIKMGGSQSFLDSESKPIQIVHLMVVHKGNKDITWETLQKIKNELVSDFSDGVEIYPSENRRMNVKQRHLWCFPPGFTFPLGLMPHNPAIEQAMKDVDKVLRETTFFVVQTSDKTYEVFVAESEAKMKLGDKLGPSKTLPMSHVPTGAGTIMSPLAITSFNEAQLKIKTIMEAVKPTPPVTPEDGPSPDVVPGIVPEATGEAAAAEAAYRNSPEFKEGAPGLHVVKAPAESPPEAPVDAEAEAKAAEELKSMRESLVKGPDGGAVH